MRRLLSGYGSMVRVWAKIGMQRHEEQQYAHAAFANKKEEFYKGLFADAMYYFKKLGLSWGRYNPSEHLDLLE